MAPIHHPWVFTFGLLGNIISFIVYLAPIPTFIRIYKKKSTEGFQSIPYICAIFSSMLWLYYAMVKTNTLLLITINSFGCVIETIYIAIYLTYADKQAKMWTIKVVVLLNLVGFSSILIICHYLLPTQSLQVQVLGWICVGFATVVFASPLSIIRLVIRTKSVEFMPFPLSLTLTISAVMWFMYGLLLKDMYILFPNILGFTFGVAQMVLYAIYRKPSSKRNTVQVILADEEKAQIKLTNTTTTTSNPPQIQQCSSPDPVVSPLSTTPKVNVEDNKSEEEDGDVGHHQIPNNQLPHNVDDNDTDHLNGVCPPCHDDLRTGVPLPPSPVAMSQLAVDCTV